METNLNIEAMERLHLRVVNGTIDVLYRPNHSYIAFVDYNKEGLDFVKKLANMSREEFAEYLNNVNCFNLPTREKIEEIKTSNLENWYKNAWRLDTERILKEINMQNPIEQPILG